MTARFLAGLAVFLGLQASWLPSAALAETWQLKYVGMLGQVPLMTADLRAEIADEGSGMGAFYVTADAGTAGTGAESLFPFQIWSRIVQAREVLSKFLLSGVCADDLAARLFRVQLF